MKRVFLCLFMASTTPAFAQEPLRPELRKLLDVALEPKAFHGQTVEVGCLITSANLVRAICPVWNESGAGIGAATLDIEPLDSALKRSIVNRCAGSGQEVSCYAVVTAKVDATYSFMLKPIKVTLPPG